MKRFAGSIAVLAVLALGAWLALGTHERRGRAASDERAAPHQKAQPNSTLVDPPRAVPPVVPAVAAEPESASSTREAVTPLIGEEPALTHRADDSISGRVLWPDGTPAKASVSAVEESEEKLGTLVSQRVGDQETSADGRFEFAGLDAGPFRIHARGEQGALRGERDASGGKQKERETWSCEQEHVAVGTSDLVLTLSSGLEVSGRVVDERRASVDEFSVDAQRAGRTFPWSDATNTLSRSFHDSGGAFVLTGLCPGAWELRLTAQGYADSNPVPVDVPSAAPLELVLFHTASVRGIVLDSHGAPISGAKVSAAEDRQWSSPRNDGVLPTDESGAFAIDWLLPGHVTLFASRPGCAPSEPLPLELAPGQAQDGLLLRLRAAGTIAGDVLGPGSIPEMEQFVYMHEKDPDGHSDGARTDTQGRFAFTGVPAGEYSIEARTSAGLQLDAEITLREGENGRVRLGPPDAGVVKLHGSVTIGGKAPGEIHLSASHGRMGSDRRPSDTQCDRDGAYELTVRGAGHYSVMVSVYGGDVFSWNTAVDVPQVPEFAYDIVVPVGRVRGRVTSRDGAPLADVVVRSDVDLEAAAEGLFKNFRTHTDSDGRYELLVAAGPLTVIVGGNDWPWNENAASWSKARAAGLSVAANQELDGIDLVLSPGGTLAGRVRRSDGGPVSRVMILDYGGTPPGRMLAATEEDGRFQIHGLEPGTLLVEARTGSVVTRPVSATIEPEKTTEIEIELVPAPSGPGH